MNRNSLLFLKACNFFYFFFYYMYFKISYIYNIFYYKLIYIFLTNLIMKCNAYVCKLPPSYGIKGIVYIGIVWICTGRSPNSVSHHLNIFYSFKYEHFINSVLLYLKISIVLSKKEAFHLIHLLNLESSGVDKWKASTNFNLNMYVNLLRLCVWQFLFNCPIIY